MKKLLLIYLFTPFYLFAQTPKPSARQLAWQQRELTMFAHFTVNTYTDREWGLGTESPAIFNPSEFDANQWAKAAKAGGFKMILLTAKHHDGFCLWPSKYTEHSVKNSPWKAGKGDIVNEVAQACKAHGLKFGVYLSPWDRHEASYGTASYNQFYKNQLTELMSNYGEISEVWFDGAKGENAKDMNYDFEGYWKIIRTLQPNAVLFSDIGPDVRWVGNEKGIAGQTCWSTINLKGLAIGNSDTKRLNEGNKDGKTFLPAESDVSIRKGWFFHAHPIEMTERAPWRRPMMFNRLFKAGSLPSAAWASPRKRRPAPAHSPWPDRRNAPSIVTSVRVAASPLAALPRSVRR